ncbi:MAG: adenylate/guanylate cyclase domain-containing protein, partial [Cyclobacteriaceae bacterium]|nr:adenylate/guanylate cyclase domain-containing protein [Cyclobacteriaceae bacterium]
AKSHVSKYEYDQAILDYEDAINLLKNKGDEVQTNFLKDKIVEIKKLQNINEEVVQFYNDAIIEQERLIEELSQETIGDTLMIYAYPKDSIEDQTDLGIERLVLRSNSFNDLADEFLEKKDYDQAERYRLLHLQVEDEIKKRENAETQLTLLHQQKQIAEFNLQTKNRELEGQRKTKQNFIIGGALLLALALALLALYLSKKRDHKKLGQAYRVLEDTKSKLSVAEENIRKLLRQQVSEDIAKELMTGGTSLSTKKSFVCVMFLDIRDFTSWAEKRDPEEIIKYQNKIFGFMIDLVNEFNGNINQLLGDGFMATFGAPISGGNDCQNAFNAAMKIIQNLNK